METVKQIALVLHILSGFIALGCGLAAIIFKKGQNNHRKSGLLFFYSMQGVCFTALIISVITANKFLLLIGIFTFFQNYFGRRAIKEKSLQPNFLDWLVVAIGSVSTIFMLTSNNIVLIVFGVISFSQLFSQVRIYFMLMRNKTLPKTQWLIQHVGMMLGTYIATLTAFLVVNLYFIQPQWIVWLAPSVIGGTFIAIHQWRIKNNLITTKIRKPAIAVILFFVSNSLTAQVYVEGGNTRHRFAQTNIGVDTRTFFGNASYTNTLNADGILVQSPLGSQTDMRLILGGTHFWGHADFFVAFPILDLSKTGFRSNVETGARYYPWRIEQNKLRPFVGMSILPYNFKQGEGTVLVRTKYPVSAGFTFNVKNHLFEIGAGFNYQNSDKYYYSTTQQASFKTPPFWFSFGYKFILETTATAEKDWLSGDTKKLTDTLAARKKLNGITLAAGPSSAFFTGNSPHNSSTKPFLDQHKGVGGFGDFGIGYYWNNPDIQLNVTWRSYKSEISAYGHQQIAQRKSLGIEAFKFISDYHGFAAFIGPVISYEQLSVTDIEPDETSQTGTFEGIKPGIIFGWDIRPNRLQSLILRTNLRYYPRMNIDMPGGQKFVFDQLEFNFIQVVIFPGRLF